MNSTQPITLWLLGETTYWDVIQSMLTDLLLDHRLTEDQNVCTTAG